MGEVELIAQFMDASPWIGAALFGVFLLRKEIGGLLMSGRNETAMEALLLKMCGLFEKNLEYFGRVEKGVESMVRNGDTANGHMKELAEIQRAIELEVARQGGRR